LYNLVVLCETNVLNIISQRLDTICQIKPKRAIIHFPLFRGTKHSHNSGSNGKACIDGSGGSPARKSEEASDAAAVAAVIANQGRLSMLTTAVAQPVALAVLLGVLANLERLVIALLANLRRPMTLALAEAIVVVVANPGSLTMTS
jgi:hypothetical protein